MASSARIDELRKKFDENPRRYFAPLANEYRKAGDPEQAILICQEYLPQQPGHMSGHIVYGQALFELNRHEEARTVFETALSLDPENLIALRHLGDIARNAGDLDSARIWYQRVLEADPRNEEIAQLMLSLLADKPAAAPAPAVDHNAPTPLSTPAVSAPPAPAMEADTGFAVEKAEDTTLDAGMAHTEPSPFSIPEPAPEPKEVAPAAPPVSQNAPKEEELLDLDSFDLGGVPLSTMRESKAAAAEPAPEPMIAMETPSEPAADDNATLDEGAFEADPFAIAAAPTPEPEIEMAADLDIGLPDDSPATVEGGTLGGLETFEAGVLSAEPPAEAFALETESFFEAPPVTEPAPEPEPVAQAQPEPEPEPVEAFVTETMATLYLQQGHLESALDIYRKLVEQRPDDAGLRTRLQAVEDQVNGAAAPEPEIAEPEPEPEYVAPAPTYGGPTIREFLAGIVSRRTPVYSEPVATPEPEPQPQPESEPVAAEPDGMRRPSGEFRPTPSSTETVSGSLGALFSGADAAAADTNAANTLAEAFAPEGPETAPLVGKPAHRASNELSLNNVFKGGEPRPASGEEGFSFDQFFSESAQSEAAEGTDTPASGTPEATDDIAQFNAWLNGLKKT